MQDLHGRNTKDEKMSGFCKKFVRKSQENAKDWRIAFWYNYNMR